MGGRFGAAGRVGSDFLSAIAGRVGSTFRRVGSGRVGSGPRKVTRGQLCVGMDIHNNSVSADIQNNIMCLGIVFM